MSTAESADKPADKKVAPATPASDKPDSADKADTGNAFDKKRLNILHPEDNQQLATAKLLDDVQKTRQAKSSFTDKDFEDFAESYKSSKKLKVALENAQANQYIADTVCKADPGYSASAKDFNDFVKTGMVDVKNANGKAADGAAAKPTDHSKDLQSFGGLSLAQAQTGESNEKIQTQNVLSKEELTSTFKAATEKDAKAKEIFDSMNGDVLAKHPEWKISKEGNATIRRDASGKEVFRQEGTVTTLTVDGIRYMSDSKNGTKQIVGADGKVELIRYNNGMIDIPGDKGSAVRYYPGTNSISMVDSQNRIISDTVRPNGDLLTTVRDSAIETRKEAIDFNHPDAAIRQLMGMIKDEKTGIVSFTNGQAALSTGDSKKGPDGKEIKGRPELAIMSKNGEQIHLIDSNRYAFFDGKSWTIRSLDGKPPQPMTRDIWQKVKQLSEAGTADGPAPVKTTLTNGASVESRPDANNPNLRTIVATVPGAVSTLMADGTRVVSTDNGEVRTIKPDSTDVDIQANGQHMTLGTNGLRTPKFDIDRSGKVTDRRNNTVMSQNTIATRDGTVFNSETNSTRFSDGVTVDRYGSVSHSSAEANVAANHKSEAAAQEAKALGAVANAQSMVSEILSKASSGKVTSSDIAALSATLGGLEANIKLLANEVDPGAMIRVMMTKSMVSDSLGQAQSMIGKTDANGNPQKVA